MIDYGFRENRAVLQVFEKGYFDNPTEASSAIFDMVECIAKIEKERDAALERMQSLAVSAYQSGYARGHDDTVESGYNGSIVEEPEAALEWLSEQPPEDIDACTHDGYSAENAALKAKNYCAKCGQLATGVGPAVCCNDYDGSVMTNPDAEWWAMKKKRDALQARVKELERPIPMVLFCPACNEQHIDAPEPDSGWDNPPHKSHLCHRCGTVWRPTDKVYTTGVAFIDTLGASDNWMP